MMSRLAEEGRNSYEEPEAVKLVKKIVGAIRHCHSVRPPESPECARNATSIIVDILSAKIARACRVA